ncbi:MAG: 3-oxoacyl-[acyl-carrier-protein] reductase [Thermostichales cyanobacterium SZTDM-1c_bins_54]
MALLLGQVAVVTGASRGIGAAIAKALAAEGAAVGINYSSSAAAAAAVQEEITAQGGKAFLLPADIGDPEAVEGMFAQVQQQWGRLDVLVNNAGITRDGLLLRMKLEDWQAVVQTNLTGTFLCLKAAAKLMVKQRRGRIINIASVIGLMGNAGQANYSAAKAGVIGLTKAAARELAARTITVNAVAPGFIQTQMTENLDTTALLQQIPLHSLGTVEQVAGVVRFLAADPAAAYITGQVITIDGGLVMA